MKKFFFLCCFSFLWGGEPDAVYLTWEKSPESTMTVQWITTDKETDDHLEYREKGEEPWNVIVGAHQPLPGTYPYLIHRLALSQLEPDTLYEFRIGAEGQTRRFATAPKELEKPLRFVVGGDVYHDTIDTVKGMNREAAATNPLFALVGGDLVYSDGLELKNPQRMHRWMDWLAAWTETMVTKDGRSIPLIPAIGNHEVEGHYGQTPDKAPFFYALFPFPGEEGYNALDFGNYMSLIILDSGHTHPIEGKQTAWLAKTLEARKNVPHKFALYHVGAYPSKRAYDRGEALSIRRYWVPVFDRLGLQTAFEHHDHAYKRTHLLKDSKPSPQGVLYLGDGAWGVDRPRTPALPRQRWYLATTAKKRHVIAVTLDPEKTSYHAIDDSGKIIDAYSH